MDSRPTAHPADIAAAMLVWYASALREFPAGLVTQAQAAKMLAVNRMAISRMLSAGHLTAVYFPRPPDIAGVAVGRDDRRWLRLAAILGLDPNGDVGDLPKACYVSFADVVRLWRAAPAKESAKRSWTEALTEVGLEEATDGEASTAEGGPEAWML